MREILFRGKRKDSGEWLEGDLQTVGHKRFIDGSRDRARVSPETVGQYTGLEDKKGKKIFEGDIVELWTTDTGKKYKAAVAFGNPNGRYSWGWQLVTERGFPLNGDILLWVEMEDGGAFCEVIGNIHDNPELRRK